MSLSLPRSTVAHVMQTPCVAPSPCCWFPGRRASAAWALAPYQCRAQQSTTPQSPLEQGGGEHTYWADLNADSLLMTQQIVIPESSQVVLLRVNSYSGSTDMMIKQKGQLYIRGISEYEVVWGGEGLPVRLLRTQRPSLARAGWVCRNLCANMHSPAKRRQSFTHAPASSLPSPRASRLPRQRSRGQISWGGREEKCTNFMPKLWV